MTGLFLLAVFVMTLVVFAVSARWTFLRGRRLQRGFARFLDDAQTRWGFTGGRLTILVCGTYAHRPVTVEVVHRSDGEGDVSTPGRVVVAMQARARDSEAWKSGLATLDDPDLSRATFDLEGRYGLVLSCSGGILKALSESPPGWMFAGRFDEGRWRNVLLQMHVVAQWLEKHAP